MKRPWVAASSEATLPAPSSRRPAAWLALLLIALALGGCSQLRRHSAGDPGRSAIPEPPPAPTALEQVELGEQKILAGEWEEAAALFEGLLADPAGEHLDRALLRAAMIRLHPQSPLRRPTRGYAYLERLLAERPDSLYAAEAALILALRREQRSLAEEVERLRTQLDELRQIDLEPSPGRRD